MRISKVKATALKGRSFSHALAPATLITGPNFSGKTSIIEAIRLAILGYLPELGKKNSATMDLASGREMTVAIEVAGLGTIELAGLIDDDSTLARRFWMERGTCKSEVSAGPWFTQDFVTPLMDAGEYFSLSEKERVDYVASRVKLPEEFGMAGIIAKLERLSFADAHSEEIETAKTETVALCREQPQDKDVQTWLTDLIALLKDDFSQWNKRAQESQGTVKMLTELKLREAEASAETLADLTREEAHLAGLIDECNREYGGLSEQTKTAFKLAQRRLELRNLLAQPEPDWTVPQVPAPTPPVKPDTTQLEADMATVTAELGKLTEPDPETMVRKRNAASDALAATQEALKSAMGMLAKRREEMAEVCALKQCPYCHSHAKGWQNRVLAQMGSEIESLQSEATKAQADHVNAAKEYERAEEKYVMVRRALEQFNNLTSLKDSLTRDLEKKQREAALAEERYQNHFAKIERENQYAAEKVAQGRRAWIEGRQAAADELAVIEEVPSPPSDSLEAVSRRGEDLRDQRNGVATKIRDARRLQQDLIRANQAAKEHRLAAARAKVVKKVRETLQEQKGEMVAAAFRELLVTANSLAGGIIPSDLEYNPETNELGRVGPAGFIPHKAFSGTEQALAYVSIALALSVKAPFKLLIMDELGRLTDTLRQVVLNRLSALCRQGEIDQVIAIVPAEGAVTAQGYTVIQLR